MRQIVSAFDNEWTPELLDEVYNGIEEIAVKEWNYDIYRNQMELISAEGMLEAYATIGLPIMYHHWSFGKRYLSQSRLYKAGVMGLAYEIVINSDPCISYLMDSNTLAMQTIVIAHACMGHNHFFKNNYMFRQWTQPDAIIDYLAYAKRFITKQEEIHGFDEVEVVLDAAHTLSHYSVDKYQKRDRTTVQLEADLKARQDWEDSQYDPLSSPFIERKKKDADEDKVEETENLLYFIELYAPNLRDWQREIIRIVRKIGQYFYPQRQVQVMNEGFATTSHYEICHELYNRGLVDERFMFEFLQSHSGVLGQVPLGIGNLRRINPYALGFRMFQDIRRRCEFPTKEDEQMFPDQVGRPFREVYFEAVKSYKDESFILQYLSPEVIRKMGLMTLLDDDKNTSNYVVSGNADDGYFDQVRKQLAFSYDLGVAQPHISIYDADWKGTRTLKLRHQVHQRRPIDETETKKILRHIYRLWQFPVTIESIYEDGTKRTLTWPS